MRDPKRIDKILKQLAIAWKNSPDLRLGQLLVNVAGDKKVVEFEKNVFYYEDEFWENDLKNWNKKVK